MTFVWTEMSFLSMWFETAHEARKANFRALIEEGRFEILTGGWVKALDIISLCLHLL